MVKLNVCLFDFFLSLFIFSKFVMVYLFGKHLLNKVYLFLTCMNVTILILPNPEECKTE